MPDEWTDEIPEEGRCKECDKFCNIHTDLADVLYFTVTESTSVKLNRRNTHEMSHIRNCDGHAPTKSTLAKYPDIEWDAQIRAFYIMEKKPIRNLQWVKKEITRREQPKRKTTSNGTQTRKKRLVTRTIEKLDYVTVGYELVPRLLGFNELPDELKKHHVFRDE